MIGSIFKFYLLYFIDYAITVVTISPPLSPSTQHPHSLRPSLFHCSCPWLMHISSLATPFSTLYFTSPWLFCTYLFVLLVFKDFFYLFIYRERGKGGRERERNITAWLPLARPLLGTRPATQTCALTRNRTGDSLVLRLALNPLNHTSQG